MLKVEFCYVSNCPVVTQMRSNIKEAVSGLDFEVNYSEKILDKQKAIESSRGCPTLLVNGRDLVGIVKCKEDSSFCRNYQSGIPTAEEIKNFINWNY